LFRTNAKAHTGFAQPKEHVLTGGRTYSSEQAIAAACWWPSKPDRTCRPGHLSAT